METGVPMINMSDPSFKTHVQNGLYSVNLDHPSPNYIVRLVYVSQFTKKSLSNMNTQESISSVYIDQYDNSFLHANM